MKDLTIEQCIDMAKNEADRKIKTNKLFKSCDESPESLDFENGDPETLYSLSSMYGQFVEDDLNDIEDAIYNQLAKSFPEYV